MSALGQIFSIFLFHPKPKVTKKLRDGFMVFDMTKMHEVGYNAFWWPQERPRESVCIFGPRVQSGDLLIDGAGNQYVLTLTWHPENPGDQYFASCYPLKNKIDPTHPVFGRRDYIE